MSGFAVKHVSVIARQSAPNLASLTERDTPVANIDGQNSRRLCRCLHNRVFN